MWMVKLNLLPPSVILHVYVGRGLYFYYLSKETFQLLPLEGTFLETR